MQILLAGPGDYVMNGASSRCIQMVQNAARNRQSRLMFTPTLFWVDDNYQQRKSVNSQVRCHPFLLENILLVGKGMSQPRPHSGQCTSVNSEVQGHALPLRDADAAECCARPVPACFPLLQGNRTYHCRDGLLPSQDL